MSEMPDIRIYTPENGTYTSKAIRGLISGFSPDSGPREIFSLKANGHQAFCLILNGQNGKGNYQWYSSHHTGPKCIYLWKNGHEGMEIRYSPINEGDELPLSELYDHVRSQLHLALPGIPSDVEWSIETMTKMAKRFGNPLEKLEESIETMTIETMAKMLAKERGKPLKKLEDEKTSTLN